MVKGLPKFPEERQYPGKINVVSNPALRHRLY